MQKTETKGEKGKHLALINIVSQCLVDASHSVCCQTGEIPIPCQDLVGLRNSGVDFLMIFPIHTALLVVFSHDTVIGSIDFAKTIKIVNLA